MRTPLFILTLLATVPLHRVEAQGVGAAVSDSSRLQGAWTMASGAADGVPMPSTYLTTMKRVLSGNVLTVTMGGRLYFQATIHLDPSHTPKTIDYHMTAGFTAGAVQRGIYEFIGDTVRFCFGAPNAARPAEFRTVPGDGRTLSAWVPSRP